MKQILTATGMDTKHPTVKGLTNLLSQAKGHRPVRVNMQLRGDGRKSHSPWADEIRLSIDHGEVILRCYFPELGGE